jgi:hypothetical protein
MKELKEFLVSLPSGAIEAGEVLDRLISLLAAAWDEIPGSDQEATYAYKLSRMESVEWDGEVLEFTLERHGPTALGSSRANLHRWRVSFDPPDASFSGAGFRVVGNISPKWYPDEIVSELSQAILNGKEHPHVKWINENQFRVFGIGALVPGDCKQTLSNRRYRFRSALRARLSSSGWKETSPYKFTKDVLI